MVDGLAPVGAEAAPSSPHPDNGNAIATAATTPATA